MNLIQELLTLSEAVSGGGASLQDIIKDGIEKFKASPALTSKLTRLGIESVSFKVKGPQKADTYAGPKHVPKIQNGNVEHFEYKIIPIVKYNSEKEKEMKQSDETGARNGKWGINRISEVNGSLKVYFVEEDTATVIVSYEFQSVHAKITNPTPAKIAKALKDLFTKEVLV